MIIAHRGIHNNIDIPENSIKAFELAKSKNYAIELDIHLTLDNELVVFHDDNLKRMTGIDKNVDECTYLELSKIKLLNTNCTIPSLDMVLDLINGDVLIDIEIKNTKRIDDICNILLAKLSKYSGNVMIKSFNPFIVKKVKSLTKSYKTGLLITDNYNNYLYNFLNKFNLFIKICRPDFIAINKKLLNKKYYRNKCNKYETFIWTVKNLDEIDSYSKFKALSFICNNIPIDNKKNIK